MADFFDKMKKNINKGVSTVGVKSTTMLETTKIKSQISSLKTKKEDTFKEMGSMCFDMLEVDDLDKEALNEKADIVKKIDLQIAEKEMEIVKIQEEEKEILSKDE